MQFLSPSFTLAEFTVSQEAARRDIDNTPPPWVVENLARLVKTLDEVRAALGNVPILVSSGYRSTALNQAVGGAPNSAHMSGLAADFIAPRFGSPFDVCQAIIRHNIEFDQLIYEHTWVHLGLAPDHKAPRGQILTYRRGVYVPGVVRIEDNKA
jgi:zinc D-Ala-D-Ala carboxypeptidase